MANERIVCAAVRKSFTGETVLCLHHNDLYARQLDNEGDPVDEGFMTNFGRWVSPEEAWYIAERQGQLLQYTHINGKLTTENLY